MLTLMPRVTVVRCRNQMDLQRQVDDYCAELLRLNPVGQLDGVNAPGTTMLCGWKALLSNQKIYTLDVSAQNFGGVLH